MTFDSALKGHPKGLEKGDHCDFTSVPSPSTSRIYASAHHPLSVPVRISSIAALFFYVHSLQKPWLLQSASDSNLAPDVVIMHDA